MPIFSYDQRVRAMQKPGDEDKQLQLATRYVKRLKSKLRAADSLTAKILIQSDIKEAEMVVNKLRHNIFDHGDMLAKKRELATSSRYVVVVPALCGDGVILGEDGPALFNSLAEAQCEVNEDPDDDLCAVEVKRSATGDWTGLHDGVNWSAVARRQSQI
tara:strand:+ start:127 stop:603 length:477 start_codon:yes stop_codon:yes gene_type:complete